jgi:uncharacterized protein YjgD (DUF1641 family)
MGKPIAIDIPVCDPRDGVRARVEAAPVEHAQAVLAAYEVLQALHDRGILDLLRGALGAGDKIVESAVDAARAPESIRAMRNVLLLSKALGTIEPELFAGFVHAIPEAMVQAGREDSRPWPLFRALLSRDFRRGLGAVNRLLEALGRHMAPKRDLYRVSLLGVACALALEASPARAAELRCVEWRRLGDEQIVAVVRSPEEHRIPNAGVHAAGRHALEHAIDGEGRPA